MPSLSCCTPMKRKSNGVGVLEGEGVEGKRGRVENGEGEKVAEGQGGVKCAICLWPSASPQCYHPRGGAAQPAS